MLFKIFEGNLEHLEKKLSYISNKCRKYGCDFRYEKIGETYEEVKDSITGITCITRFVLVEVEGTAKIDDWEFVATLEHTCNGNIITRYSDIEIPEEYYVKSPACDHCHSNRDRKNTYIIRNIKTGEFKQVGKTCLKDFTGGLSAEMAAQYISGVNELRNGENINSDCEATRYISLNDFLVYAGEVVRCFGYKKRNEFEPGTGDRAAMYYYAVNDQLSSKRHQSRLLEEMDQNNFDPTNSFEYVKNALDWIKMQPEENVYFHNLKVACSLEYISPKHFGLLASLFPTYERAVASDTGSEYIGEINERITVKIHSVECVTSYETDFGTTRIYKFLDGNNNVIIWKTAKILDDHVDAITGTVKAHKEFRGVKQNRDDTLPCIQLNHKEEFMMNEKQRKYYQDTILVNYARYQVDCISNNPYLCKYEDAARVYTEKIISFFKRGLITLDEAIKYLYETVKKVTEAEEEAE